MIEFGSSLRRAREAKGYSVAQIADLTRMAPRTVQELESENFSHIAAPIYGRGFVKLYCEAVGLDPRPFIDEFMAIYNGVHDVGIKERTPPRPAPAAASGQPPPPPAFEPPPAVAAGPLPEAASEPPPLSLESPDLPAHDAGLGPSAQEPPSAPLSRYAAPVRQEESNAPAVTPAVWRIGVLAAAGLLVLWVAAVGIRALYRATSTATGSQAEAAAAADGPDENPQTDSGETPGTAAEKPAAEPAAKPAGAAVRTPQKIPSLYID